MTFFDDIFEINAIYLVMVGILLSEDYIIGKAQQLANNHFSGFLVNYEPQETNLRIHQI